MVFVETQRGRWRVARNVLLYMSTLAAEIVRLWRDDAARVRQLQAAQSITTQGADAFERTVSALVSLINPTPTTQSKANASA